MTEIRGSLYPEDWKKAARKDWHRVYILINDSDAEGAAFFLQQALEKYLKAFLIAKGWKLKKIHELDALLDYSKEFNHRLERFVDLCEKASGYYFTERYPMLVPSGLTTSEIANDMSIARELVCELFPEENEFVESSKESISEGNSQDSCNISDGIKKE